MEEIDVSLHHHPSPLLTCIPWTIKQGSPFPKKPSKRSQSSRPHRQPLTNELSSFVDMLFSGKLTNILVCQECIHVSYTYEVFSSLSLSIKLEDCVRNSDTKRIGITFYVGAPQQRSSSVPATPIRDSHLDSPEASGSQRRQSIDLADVDIVVEPAHIKQDPGDTTKDDPTLHVLSLLVPDSPSILGIPTDTPQPVSVLDLVVPNRPAIISPSSRLKR